MSIVLLLIGMAEAMAADVRTNGQTVTVWPDGGEARVVRLEVMSDRIIRVRATSADRLPNKPKSLIIVPEAQTRVPFDVKEDSNAVYVKAAKVTAVADKKTGAVTFFDKNGQQLLGEEKDGKRFWK